MRGGSGGGNGRSEPGGHEREKKETVELTVRAFPFQMRAPGGGHDRWCFYSQV